MHYEAQEWIDKTVYQRGLEDSPTILDIGGRDINGAITYLFSGEYVTLDILEGADIQADAATWTPDRQYDLVVSTETLEHAEQWDKVVKTMAAACKPGGHLLITAACDPRQPHSGIDGAELRQGEYYGNVNPQELEELLRELLTEVKVETHPHGDVYAIGQK